MNYIDNGTRNIFSYSIFVCWLKLNPTQFNKYIYENKSLWNERLERTCKSTN